MLDRLRRGVARTRKGFAAGLYRLLGSPASGLDEANIEELEALLLTADVGVAATSRLIAALRRGARSAGSADGPVTALRNEMLAMLEGASRELVIPADREGPFVILMVGVNGSGKTTTIAKLAKHMQSQGRSVMLAAGDTFRAAAVEQLLTWGRRHQVPVMAQKTGADSAAVIFDAFSSAKAKGIDVLIADTAGRLHTQSNLMEELKKIRRVIGRQDPGAPHETLLVIDATVGQNGLVQARQFNEAVGLTGIVLSKLDGSAKGGILLALAEQVGIPICFIGVGESADDLLPFEAEAFVDALLVPADASPANDQLQ